MTASISDFPVDVQVALINAANKLAVSKITAKGWKFDSYIRDRYWFKESLNEVVDAYKKECKS